MNNELAPFSAMVEFIYNLIVVQCLYNLAVV